MIDHGALLSGFERYLLSLDAPLIDRFLDAFEWRLPPRPLVAQTIPVTNHLRALRNATDGDLLGLLVRHAGELHWGQTYTSADFEDRFLKNYGWVELFGTRGHFSSEAMAGGFLMLGPGMEYPDHHHLAEEIYVPLTDGTLWSKDRSQFVSRNAGEIIHHPSGINHAMQTLEQPLVALYLWRGGPLSEKPTLRGTYDE